MVLANIYQKFGNSSLIQQMGQESVDLLTQSAADELMEEITTGEIARATSGNFKAAQRATANIKYRFATMDRAKQTADAYRDTMLDEIQKAVESSY